MGIFSHDEDPSWSDVIYYEEQVKELKAENDRLKEEIKNNKSAYKVELGTYNMECGNLLEENKQLWQTLQEIKNIVEEAIKTTGTISAGFILQKITEAEEE